QVPVGHRALTADELGAAGVGAAVGGGDLLVLHVRRAVCGGHRGDLGTGPVDPDGLELSGRDVAVGVERTHLDVRPALGGDPDARPARPDRPHPVTHLAAGAVDAVLEAADAGRVGGGTPDGHVGAVPSGGVG